MSTDRCEWREDDEGVWDTACGQRFVFMAEEGPVANGMRFCCYCGECLRETQYAPPADEDDAA